MRLSKYLYSDWKAFMHTRSVNNRAALTVIPTKELYTAHSMGSWTFAYFPKGS